MVDLARLQTQRKKLNRSSGHVCRYGGVCVNKVGRVTLMRKFFAHTCVEGGRKPPPYDRFLRLTESTLGALASRTAGVVCAAAASAVVIICAGVCSSPTYPHIRP